MENLVDDDKIATEIKGQGIVSVSDGEALAEEARKLGMPYMNKSVPVFIDVLNIIPEDVARGNQMVVFEKKENIAKVGIVDPQNINALNVLRFISEKTQLQFEVYLISLKVFQDLVVQYSGGAEKAIEEAADSLRDDATVGEEEGSFAMGDGGRGDSNVQSAPVTKLLSVIIRHAIDGKASDIHIEPIDKEYRVLSERKNDQVLPGVGCRKARYIFGSVEQFMGKNELFPRAFD